MAVAIHQISPVAHLPLVLGVIRKLNVAALIDTFCAPHPVNVTTWKVIREIWGAQKVLFFEINRLWK